MEWFPEHLGVAAAEVVGIDVDKPDDFVIVRCGRRWNNRHVGPSRWMKVGRRSLNIEPGAAQDSAHRDATSSRLTRLPNQVTRVPTAVPPDRGPITRRMLPSRHTPGRQANQTNSPERWLYLGSRGM
jgi:hypothetical protein